MNQTDTLVINLNEAHKNKVEVKFSEVVKRVEYIQPDRKKLILASKPDDNPIICIYWTQ